MVNKHKSTDMWTSTRYSSLVAIKSSTSLGIALGAPGDASVVVSPNTRRWRAAKLMLCFLALAQIDRSPAETSRRATALLSITTSFEAVASSWALAAAKKEKLYGNKNRSELEEINSLESRGCE